MPVSQLIEINELVFQRVTYNKFYVMSSWFSGNLSQNFTDLTGQLSNFTKEVLTEGTEEQDGA